jgi:hypothetical protein
MVGEAFASVLVPGEILDGRYRIEEELGRGVLALVVAATHLHLKTRVVIKAFVGVGPPSRSPWSGSWTRRKRR